MYKKSHKHRVKSELVFKTLEDKFETPLPDFYLLDQ